LRRPRTEQGEFELNTPSSRGRRRLVALALVVPLLGACALSIQAPTSGQTLTTLPVAAKVGANSTITLHNVQRTINGVSTDVTADFHSVDQYSAQAIWTTLANGTYTLTATADVYCWYCSGTNVSTATGTFTLNVATTQPPAAPTLTSIAPTSGPVGTSITLTGTGFASGMIVMIGGQQAAPVTMITATSAKAPVPANLSGTVNVNVQVGTQSSGSRPFSITTAPPMLTRVLRTGDSNIQLVDVTTAGVPTTVGQPFSAGLSAGGLSNTVGCAVTGARFLRSTSTNVESCPVDASGTVGPTCISAGAQASSTASDLAVSGSLVVRATDSGIQVFSLAANGSLTLVGTSNTGTSSPTGSAVDFPNVTNPTFVVRGHASGIDVFDIASPSSPVLTGRVTTAGLSSTGVDVKVIGTTTVVRAYSSGLDQYDITSHSAPTLSGAGPLNVDLSASRSAVALFANDTRAVRSTSVGIETFDVTSNPVRSGRISGALSATGSDVVIDRDGFAVRSTADTVEVYDVATNPASPIKKGSVSVSSSATGVCLGNR
jgi:hypothetical protein